MGGTICLQYVHMISCYQRGPGDNAKLRRQQNKYYGTRMRSESQFRTVIANIGVLYAFIYSNYTVNPDQKQQILLEFGQK